MVGDDGRLPLLSEDDLEGRQASERIRCKRGVKFKLLDRLGLRSGEEFYKVLVFMTAAFSGNAFFVIGRNVGTVLFLTHLGADNLTAAIFLSGVASLFFGQMFSVFSKRRPPAAVYGWLLGSSSVVLLFYYVLVVMMPTDAPSAVYYFAFYGVYIAEDTLTMFIAMQSASVAQSAFAVAEAKRLFGLVQLGNSFAAMTVGITIGSIADYAGTNNLLPVQIIILLGSLLLNFECSRMCSDSAHGKRRRKLSHMSSTGISDEPWWRNLLVLAMGLWGFTVIFTKTMYEYQYNVLVSGQLSSEEMVALTGYLYAGAGMASTVINVIGTKVCLEKFGMRWAILATPLALLSSSFAVLVNPSIATTFAARLVDLCLRWSLNNTVRTVLWIAVPASQAAAAKPYIEGTIKKMGQAFNAVVISITLVVSSGSLESLSFLSMLFSMALLFCCVQVYSLYLDSMWIRIKRRELKLEVNGQLSLDPSIKAHIMNKLRNGGTAAQLETLLRFSDGLSSEDWEDFFANFDSFSTPVKAKVIGLSRKHKHRVPDEFLLGLLRKPSFDEDAAVMQSAILVVGERKLFDALPILEKLLGHRRPELRAAAAVGILKIGWGVGLGSTSSAALLVIEQMLGFQLQGVFLQRNARTSNGLEIILGDRFYCSGANVVLDVEMLSKHEKAMEEEYERFLNAGNVGQAIVLAIQLTHVKASLREMIRSSPHTPSVRRCSKITNNGAEVAKDEMVAIALNSLLQLYEPRALCSHETRLKLMQHTSEKVRNVALAFVQESDATDRQIVEETIRCLLASDTYNAAEAALRRLNDPARVQDALLAQFKFNVDRHNEIVSQRGVDVDMLSTYVDTNIGMVHLLKFMRRSLTWYSDHELDLLKASDACNELLKHCSSISDADVMSEVYLTMVDLKDKNFRVDREMVEIRIHQVAEKICKGLAVKQWMSECCRGLTSEQIKVVQSYVEMPSGSLAESIGEQCLATVVGDPSAINSALSLGLGYIDEHIYLQKLTLLELSILVAPKLVASYRSTRVLAAYKMLRSQDAISEAAVLELLDSMLPLALKVVVVPLLDSSPLEKKLGVAAVLQGGNFLRTWVDSSSPPPWTDQWFSSTYSVLGASFAAMLKRVSDLRGSRKGQNPFPHPPAMGTLLAKVMLLSKVPLYEGLLSIHLAEVAIVANVKHCSLGASLCEPGYSYVVARGSFCNPITGQTFGPGSFVQQFHSICEALSVTCVECTSLDGGDVLCVSRQQVFDLMVRLPPKFALGILKNVVRILESEAPPEQAGACRMYRVGKGGDAVTGQKDVETRDRLGSDESNILFHWHSPSPGRPLVSNGGHVDEDNDDAFQQRNGDLTLIAEQHNYEGAQHSNERKHGREASELEGVDELTVEEPDSEKDANEAGFVGASQSSYEKRGASFSLLEKLVLLQEVKIFRYIAQEYLPSIAYSCETVFKKKGEPIFEEGDKTEGKLFIVADGAVGLYKGGKLTRKLENGDTMGNTALLLNTVWRYGAFALEHTMLLTIDRRDLTDVLRGRRDLASAVIRGLYKTFTRRIKLADRFESGRFSSRT